MGLALSVVTVLVTIWFQGSKLGYYLQAIREDQDAANSLGIPLTFYKNVALMISAFFTAFAGALYGLYVGFIDPQTAVGLDISVQIVLTAIIGGIGTILGPVIGAALLVALSEALRSNMLTDLLIGSGMVDAGSGIGRFLRDNLSHAHMLIYGVLVALTILFMPDGVLGGIKNQVRKRRVACGGGRCGVTAPAPILEIRQVSKFFGGLAANSDVSFTMDEGMILGLIGPNGAGKTTLFNCITGYYPPSRGEILFKGERMNGLTPDQVCKRGMVRTWQKVRPLAKLTVLDNVVVGALVRTNSVPEAREIAGRAAPGREAEPQGRLPGRRASPSGSGRSSRWPACSPPSPACCCSTRSWAGSTRPRARTSSSSSSRSRRAA